VGTVYSHCKVGSLYSINRRAHCYERDLPERSLTVSKLSVSFFNAGVKPTMAILQDLDMLLHISVPDKLINDRRSHLFLKSLVKVGTKEEGQGNQGNQGNQETQETQDVGDSVTVEGSEYNLSSLPMSLLMELSLEDLRSLDSQVASWDRQQEASIS
jgi:hypothetical protein